jgi:hypothetical protein
MTTFNRIGKFFVAAALAAATMFAGIAGIANAQGTTASVNIDMCAVTAGMGQTWAHMYRVEAPGWFKGPMTYTVPSDVDKNFGKTTTVMDTQAGTNFVGGGGVETGDYIVVVHNGAQAEWVIPEIVMVGTPGIMHNVSGYCGRIGKNGTAANTTTGSKSGGTAAKAKKAAPVVLTPLCQAALPVAQTGGKAYVLKTGPFQGKVAFVLATNTSVLSVEAAEHMFKAGGSNAVVIDFTGVGNGDAVEIASGAYQVFNVEPTGGLTPLGFMNAHPVTQPANRTPAQIVTWINGVAHTDVDRKNATCMKYDVSLLAADPGRTGSDDFPGGLAGIVLAGIAGFALLFYYLVLPMLARLRTQTVTVIG